MTICGAQFLFHSLSRSLRKISGLNVLLNTDQRLLQCIKRARVQHLLFHLQRQINKKSKNYDKSPPSFHWKLQIGINFSKSKITFEKTFCETQTKNSIYFLSEIAELRRNARSKIKVEIVIRIYRKIVEFNINLEKSLQEIFIKTKHFEINRPKICLKSLFLS